MGNSKKTKYEEDEVAKTKQYKIKTSKKRKKGKKKHSKLKKFILILFILIVLALLTGVGIFAGIFFSDKWAITKEDLIANGNTEVYDSNKKLLTILDASEGDGNRKVITLDQMGKYTANAYIAIEDKRFYEHSGVDILRTAKATLSYALNRGGSSDVGGGSTITQQLVKNIMKDKADTGTEGIERKIREMSRAFKIEQMLNKEQILEKYLNVIFVGGSDLHGVEYGAQYYFGKSAKKLDLAESAFLAGINHAPNMYNPYDEENDHTELIKDRTKLVLYFMKEQNRISDDPAEAEKLYNEAVEKVEKGFKFKKGTIKIGDTSYFVKEAVDDAAKDLAEEKDIDFDEAVTMIKSGGYKLYTTQVSSIQKIVVDEMARDTYIEKRTITDKNEKGKTIEREIRTNAGITIIEPSTGKVVAMGGDLTQDQGTNFNYATSTARQTGSSIKPLANVAPGLEEKVITAATVYDDVRTKFQGLTYVPKNVGSYYGLCTVRKAIERSSNVVNLKIMSNVGISTAIDYLHEFGLTTYTKEMDHLTLAIGGAAHGSSTLQMAAGYATLANGGVYIEPTFYTKLTDSEGNTVVKPNQEKRRVISEANAYIISNILIDVVKGSQGSAYECAISGMDVAAKTGTTDRSTNKWLCGYTPYYAAATWYGFGAKDGIEVYKVNNAKYLWSNIMTKVHKDLDGKKFVKPDNVVTARVCLQSGKLATKACKSTYTEYFAKGTVPTACDGHVTVKLCKETNKVANKYCPETVEKYYTLGPEKENNASWKPESGKSSFSVPTQECTKHNEETNKVVISNMVGKTEAQARALLKDLVIQVVYETHSDQANGIVIRQSLTEGTKVDKGVTIILTVNKLSSGTGVGTGAGTGTSTGTETGTGTSTGTGSSTGTGTTGTGSGTSSGTGTGTSGSGTSTPSGSTGSGTGTSTGTSTGTGSGTGTSTGAGTGTGSSTGAGTTGTGSGTGSGTATNTGTGTHTSSGT